MIRVGLSLFLFTILSFPVRAGCGATELGAVATLSSNQSVTIFDGLILQGWNHLEDWRMTVRVVDGEVLVGLYQQIRGQEVARRGVVGTQYGSLRFASVTGEPLKKRVSYYDFHVGIWNKMPVPVWLSPNQEFYQQRTGVAWDKLKKLIGQLKEKTGIEVEFLDDPNQVDTFSVDVAGSQVKYGLNFRLDKLGGQFNIGVVQGDAQFEIASVQFLPSSLRPQTFSLLERVLRDQGVSANDISLIVQKISGYVTAPAAPTSVVSELQPVKPRWRRLLSLLRIN